MLLTWENHWSISLLFSSWWAPLPEALNTGASLVGCTRKIKLNKACFIASILERNAEQENGKQTSKTENIIAAFLNSKFRLNIIVGFLNGEGAL